MRTPRCSVLLRILLVSVVLLGAAACGDDDAPPTDTTSTTTDDEGATADPDPTDLEPAPDVTDLEPDDADDADAGDDEPSQSELEALEAQEICDLVTADAVSTALGAPIEDPEAGTGSTPQCSYRYDVGDGFNSNITVASLSVDDVGGATGDEAFERVLDINRTVAGGAEVDEAEIEAGDRAARLSGPLLHLGIVSSGGHLVTILAPAGDFESDQIDALIVAVARAVA